MKKPWDGQKVLIYALKDFCSHLFANKKKLIVVSRQDIIKFLSEKKDGRGILPEFSIGKLANLI